MVDAYPLTFDGIKGKTFGILAIQLIYLIFQINYSFQRLEKAKGFITSLGSHPFKTAAAITAVGTAAGVAVILKYFIRFID